MAGFDVYCAICAGPFRQFNVDDDGDIFEEDQMYDTEIANSTTTEWLSRALVMAENPGTSKVFVSGSATIDGGAYFYVEAGDDPNFPAGLINVRTARYSRERDEPLAIPFHNCCYDLLRAKIGAAAFRADILYRTFASHVQGHFPSVLTLDWGVLAKFQDQGFSLLKGHEGLVLCPTDIPLLQEYYAACPRTKAPGPSSRGAEDRQRSSTSMDFFAELPAEILFLLLDDMSLREVLALRQASKVVDDLDLTQSFWKRRVARDMPWLYDIPAEAWKDDSIDWYTVYKDLFAAGQEGHKGSMLPLINRRRIWTTMDQIMDTYFADWFRFKSVTSAILTDAHADYMPLLIDPEPTHTTCSLAAFLNEFDDIADAQPRISLYWNSTGGVSGLSITPTLTKDMEVLENVIGRTECFVKKEDFALPMDDWPLAITLITEATLVKCGGRDPWDVGRRFVGVEFSFARHDTVRLGTIDGDRRVLRPMPGNVIVGFMGAWCNEGQISKVALLEQPRDRFPIECPRITYAVGTSRNRKAERLLWRTNIPDRRLVLSQFRKGYCGAFIRHELLPMEAFIFAETDAEWASITSISGDMHMGGFRIAYADRQPRSIGPRLKTMRSMSIDGAGGERIVCINLNIEHTVRCIRFITNHGRQLVVGLPGPNPGKRYASPGLDGREPVGIYCSWGDRNLPESRLDTFGVLSRDCNLYNAWPTADESTDSHGFLWDPLPLPDSLTETGPLWGERSCTVQDEIGSAEDETESSEHETESSEHESESVEDESESSEDETESFPKSGSIVSWLNCRRLVEEVEVLSCHSTSEHRLPVVGVAFHYADGQRERVAIGYTELQVEGEPLIEDLRDWCQCRTVPYPPSANDGPHCWSDRWKPAHQRIKSLRFWLDKHGAISGMQFTDGAGNGSLFWGFKSDECSSGAIDFEGDGSDSPNVGVKFFTNDNNRHAVYDDVVVVALQAVVRA